jgi:tryptophan 2,3-dioxygenase
MQEVEKDITATIDQLKTKFIEDGQDINVYLEGLYHSDYLKYWDYINLETLLSIQKPKTAFPDELIFIVYHQLTELYFKMVIHELKQVCDAKNLTPENFIKKMKRINWFFGHLIQSFDIISVGMENEQFMKFRTALHPASGFQSVQYRMIEMMATDFINLVNSDKRADYSDYSTIDDMYEHIYWRHGAIDVKTGQKTLTLKMFEEQYSKKLVRLANKYKTKNLYSIFKRLPTEIQQNEENIEIMKRFDRYVNINWPLAHYKYAVRFLIKKDGVTPATGGTNWQKYLPPKFQKQIFFPSIYSQEEINSWGKSWVEAEVLGESQFGK